MEYVVVSQTDLDIYFDWPEQLSNYTASINYYLESAGTSTATSVTATVSTQTTALTYVYYAVGDTGAILTSEGTHHVWSEITSSTGRWRACQPVYLDVNIKGRR